MMTTVIIQARMGSTRLPGKMLMEIAGKPLLWYCISQAKQARLVDQIVLATSVDEKNKILIKKARELQVETFAGDENDVLDRYYQAAKKYNAKTIVRITGDCPLIDPEIIDKVIELYKEENVDYASNIKPPTYPDGMDVEVFSFTALEKAWKEAKLRSEREHVTPYLWKNKNLFKQANLKNDINLENIRLTVDEKEDIEVIKNILKQVGEKKYRLKNVMKAINEKPSMLEINKKFERNEGLVKSMNEDRLGKSQKLYLEAKKLIPGGTQLLSKRPEMFLPDYWPAYYETAQGCEVIDLDGNRYVDVSYMGLGSCILGSADPDVDQAVKEAITKGVMSTLNVPEEVELAKLLCKIHPWAEMTRYARTGGEAMMIAVRIARAKTNKDTILFCGYHGWHDWYLSANLSNEKELDGHLLPGLTPNGVPRGLTGTSIPFRYNDIKTFLDLINTHKDKIAAVVMEPLRNSFPETGFLETIRKKTKENDIVLVFDEITSGFRLTNGGAHLQLGVNPDIAVFAKGMSNGYTMGAVIGKRSVMEAAQSTFISSTYWTERVGPTAAIATIRKLQKHDVKEHLTKVGKQIQKGWKKLAKKHNLHIHVSGIPSLSHFSFEHEQPLVLKTAFTQIMLNKGFLANNAFYVSYAHKAHHIQKYLTAVDDTFAILSKSIKENKLQELLKGPICHAGFKRLT